MNFTDSASELTWDTPDVTSEILSPMLEEDEDTLNENLDKKYEGDDEEEEDVASVVSKPSNLKSMAPISSISEVSLADRRSLVSFPQESFFCSESLSSECCN